MDDDCIAAPSALEQLVAAAKSRPQASFLNSLVLWTDGTPCRMNIPPPTWEWTDGWKGSESVFPITSCSFVSCLVNAAYVQALGYPVKEFFIWYDDFEYTKRLAAAGPAFFVPQSVVVHEPSENLGVDWSRVSPANAWKYG
jgi:GT2 family glycosyltransferase